MWSEAKPRKEYINIIIFVTIEVVTMSFVQLILKIDGRYN